MQPTITLKELRQRSVFIATPMYGGQCFGGYTTSLSSFTALATAYELDYQLQFLFNESLIQRARNYLTDMFLQSSCSHLMFIDADITFEADHIISLLGLAGPKTDYDVVCGLYPRKAIFWDNIVAAVKQGIPAEKLDDYASSFVFNGVSGTKEFSLVKPLEIEEGATGFMMIQRHVLEKFIETYPKQKYKPDHHIKDWNGSREITAFFDCGIDPVSKRYLSEDYFFSQKVREMGGKIWMCPWMTLQHTGSFTFKGSLGALSDIGVPLV